MAEETAQAEEELPEMKVTIFTSRRVSMTMGEPVYLTRNGEGELVVMDIDAFVRREKMIKLREKLLDIERDRIAGATYYSLDELDQAMTDAIQAAQENSNA